MGSLTLIVLLLIVIGVICFLIVSKSSTNKSSAKPDAPWECDTCGAGNPSDTPQCSQCGMDQ